QQELLALVRRGAEERKAGVGLCSHLLPEIKRIFDDVGILTFRQIVAAGSVVDVIGRVQRNIILHNGFRIQVPPPSVIEARRLLKDMPEILEATSQGEA